MLLNPEKDGALLCPCGNNKFYEKDVVLLSQRPSDDTIHVTKRYKEYACTSCGRILKKVQVPV